MLKICRCYKDLDIPQLLTVYAGSLKEKMEQEGISCFQAEADFCDYLREDFFCVPNACCAVWSLEGRYVSSLRMEPYRDGYLLSGLETAPMERRQGHGTALVKAILRSYFPVYTHVHKKNRISLHLHKSCGFVVIEEHGRLLDGTVSYNYYTLCHKP